MQLYYPVKKEARPLFGGVPLLACLILAPAAQRDGASKRAANRQKDVESIQRREQFRDYLNEK